MRWLNSWSFRKVVGQLSALVGLLVVGFGLYYAAAVIWTLPGSTQFHVRYDAPRFRMGFRTIERSGPTDIFVLAVVGAGFIRFWWAGRK
jgi:hypothetical protein